MQSFTNFSTVAQSERENIKERQAQGIAAARARGVQLGRPLHPIPDNFPEVVDRWEKGELHFLDAIQCCNMSESTFYRRLRTYRSEKITNYHKVYLLETPFLYLLRESNAEAYVKFR